MCRSSTVRWDSGTPLLSSNQIPFHSNIKEWSEDPRGHVGSNQGKQTCMFVFLDVHILIIKEDKHTSVLQLKVSTPGVGAAVAMLWFPPLYGQ